MPAFTKVTLNQAIGGTATTASTATSWIPLNQHTSPFNVGFGVVPGTTQGSNTFSVQHTFDNVFDSSVTPVAFDHSTVSGKTAKIDGNYAFPVAAVRLIVVSASSLDQNITLFVRQTEQP